MFRCAFNNELSQPGEKSVELILKKRPKEYFRQLRSEYDEYLTDEVGNPLTEKVSEGWEIEKAVQVRFCNLEKAKAKWGIIE